MPGRRLCACGLRGRCSRGACFLNPLRFLLCVWFACGSAQTFPPRGKCTGLSKYPNATISEYGSISGADAMAKEIMARGPIACGIDAAPILDYQGGIVSMAGDQIDHVISVVGWGNDATAGQYWIVRNSHRSLPHPVASPTTHSSPPLPHRPPRTPHPSLLAPHSTRSSLLAPRSLSPGAQLVG